MKLDVDGTQLEAVLHTAIVQALGDNGREALIREAVKHLTTKPPSTGYGSRELLSPLMESVYQAARTVAAKHLEEKLTSDPEFIGHVEKLYADAARSMLNVGNREKLVEKLSEAMGRAISQERY